MPRRRTGTEIVATQHKWTRKLDDTKSRTVVDATEYLDQDVCKENSPRFMRQKRKTS